MVRRILVVSDSPSSNTWSDGDDRSSADLDETFEGSTPLPSIPRRLFPARDCVDSAVVLQFWPAKSVLVMVLRLPNISLVRRVLSTTLVFMLIPLFLQAL